MAESTLIRFLCESCQQFASPRNIRRWQGRCKRCDGEFWTLVVNYTDTDTETSAMGTLASLTVGVGWDSIKTSTNQDTAPGVSAALATTLCEDRRLVQPRVAEYLRSLNRERLRQQGAQPCVACEAMFVPAENKPWTQQGYCSKSCGAGAGAESAPVMFQEQTPGSDDKPTISVTCPAGHTFDVLATFAGCIRPCPECGTKCPVG